MKAIFKKELFKEWYIFYLKFNRHIVLRSNWEWCYILDLDYDPFFENPDVYLISWSSLESELIDNKAFWIYNKTIKNDMDYFTHIEDM